MLRLYLQNIIDDISFENLPPKWQGFDFSRFSKDKTLFGFQKQALQNALKGLWLYFKANTPSANSPLQKGWRAKRDGVSADTPLQKGNLYKLYQANGFTENYDYNLKKSEGKKTAKYLLEYDKDYPAVDSKISFAHFINRMSFWMATGSGKTKNYCLSYLKLLVGIGQY